jgi:phage shock protein PspC (stress-responsive transcriptional regulator)
MKEVKKCSISGIAFTMEADAFQVLSRYLESLNDTYRNTDGGKEIVEDIEARIAELILSHQDNSKVVKLSLVEEIIAQMGSAEAIREQEGREAPRGEGRIPRRLYRDMDQARLGGVCSGVAKYFGTSPTWIRLLMFLPLILLLLLGWIPFFWWLVPLMSNLLGVFFICYLIMWFAEFFCTLPEPRKPSLPSMLPEVPPAWTGTQTRLLPDRVLPRLSEIPTVSHDLPNDISGSTAAVPAFFLPVRK